MNNIKPITSDFFKELLSAVYHALENYSNVHRGSGYKSVFSTKAYEKSREIVAEYLGLNPDKFIVIFMNSLKAYQFESMLSKSDYHLINSKDAGLNIDVVAMAIRKNKLSDKIKTDVGGGTARLIALKTILWSKSPERFEAGTPAIINVICFAKALQLFKKYNLKNVLELDIPEIENDKPLIFSGEKLLQELLDQEIGKDLKVPSRNGEKQYINFDNSATTPCFKPIWNSFKSNLFKADADIIENAKNACYKFLNASKEDYEIIFSSNTTEAVNIAAKNLSRGNSNPYILSTYLEHSSNDLPWRQIKNSSLQRIENDKEGFIDFNELKSKISTRIPDLFSITAASNVLGTCNDLISISKLCQKNNIELFIDGAQIVAHKKIDISEIKPDYFAFSAHKIYAPFGAGVLLIKRDKINFKKEELSELHSFGNKNTAGIAALNKSLELMMDIGMDIISKKEQNLTKYAYEKLSLIDLRVYGPSLNGCYNLNKRVGVIPFDFEGVMSLKLADYLAYEGGFGTRAGCHCAHIIVKRMLNIKPWQEVAQKTVLSLFPKIELAGVARISFAIQNTESEVDTLFDILNGFNKEDLSKADFKSFYKGLKESIDISRVF